MASFSARRFETTAWSRVIRAADPNDPLARPALAELCQAYWYPLYAFVRRQGYPPTEAEDTVQAFFARLLEKNIIRYANPQRGHFRTFLITALKQFLARRHEYESAAKRRPRGSIVSINSVDGESRYASELVEEITPDRLYEYTWAIAVLKRAMERLRAEYLACGKSDRFEAFQGVLTGQAELSMQQIGQTIGLSEGAVRVAVHRLKQRYGELLREEVGATLQAGESVEAELRDLLEALNPVGVCNRIAGIGLRTPGAHAFPPPIGPMPTIRTCQTCGTEIPASSPLGECPVCLVQLSLTPPQGATAESPSPTMLQPHFPTLDILELIGRGGMGLVYKARHRTLDRFVAIKLLTPSLAADPALTERFLREAQAMARLAHPHIVGVYDIGRAAGTAFIVMEYVEGSSLRDRLQTGRLAPLDALKLVPQLCDAIQYAHDQGVIHRDIKPENVLLDRNGNTKIADFGLAKFEEGSAFTLTGSDVRMGTARYMAPEQWRNTASVDHRADIYSLGVMFYEMLTGELPSPQCKPPSAKVGTDRRLDGVVARSLQEEPAERYQNAADIKSDVERIATTTQRLRYVVMALAGLFLLAGAAFLGSLFRDGKQVVNETATQNPGGVKPNHSDGIAAEGADPKSRVQPPRGSTISGDNLLSSNWQWMPPENLGPGVNTEYDEGAPYVSADGLTLMFWSNRPGGQGETDLWECRRKSIDEPFADPVNVGPPINTPRGEDSPCLSADGLTLVFSSHRSGRGDADIWMATRSNLNAPWGEPVNLGPEVNSTYHEYRPWLSRDGLRLTFNSVRPPLEGVWVSRRSSPEALFEKAVPLGENYNNQAVGGVSFTQDDQTLLCSRLSRVPSFRGDLLWGARIESEIEPFKNLRSFGPAVNSSVPNDIDTAPAALGDGSRLYFQSNRQGGQGGYDLWVSRRVPRPK